MKSSSKSTTFRRSQSEKHNLIDSKSLSSRIPVTDRLIKRFFRDQFVNLQESFIAKSKSKEPKEPIEQSIPDKTPGKTKTSESKSAESIFSTAHDPPLKSQPPSFSTIKSRPPSKSSKFSKPPTPNSDNGSVIAASAEVAAYTRTNILPSSGRGGTSQ